MLVYLMMRNNNQQIEKRCDEHGLESVLVGIRCNWWYTWCCCHNSSGCGCIMAKYSQKKIIKLAFSDNFQLYNPNTGESVKFIGISVTNTGNRKVIIRTWGVHLKEGSAIVMPPLDANGIEKMAYTKLPQTLDLEESIDLQWQKDKFQLFLEANEDNIEKSKPLVFYVNDSTGKQYTVKTKKNASYYFK